MRRTCSELMCNAHQNGLVIPSFNIPYLPMLEPVARALVDADAFGLIAVARLEWTRFEAVSQAAVQREYARYAQEPWMRLHQDHVPVIDEDQAAVDFILVLRQALDLGYDAIMVDGSRLPLDQNIAVTRQVVELAAPYAVPVEGELGAVLGHEEGPLPPYEELFESGRGFTDVEEAARFVSETGVSWLSVACGSVHGAVRGSAKDQAKTRARLNIEHLVRLRDATRIPLVLHGGSGIPKESIQAGIAHGIAKINIGTDLRQPYEQAIRDGLSIDAARSVVYERARYILSDVLLAENSRGVINPA